MVNLSKISSLLLACLLFYLSISANSGYFLPGDDHPINKSNGSPEYWLAEPPILATVTKPLKNHLKSLRNLPAFNLNDFLSVDKSLDAQTAKAAAESGNEYLTFSRLFCPRIEVRTILFPFHYFW